MFSPKVPSHDDTPMGGGRYGQRKRVGLSKVAHIRVRLGMQPPPLYSYFICLFLLLERDPCAAPGLLTWTVDTHVGFLDAATAQ